MELVTQVNQYFNAAHIHFRAPTRELYRKTKRRSKYLLYISKIIRKFINQLTTKLILFNNVLLKQLSIKIYNS